MQCRAGSVVSDEQEGDGELKNVTYGAYIFSTFNKKVIFFIFKKKDVLQKFYPTRYQKIK